jgi:hypothetical protein
LLIIEDDTTDAGEGLTRVAGNKPYTIAVEDAVKLVAKFIPSALQ